MVAEGQDMEAPLLSEVTSPVSTSSLGESWGRLDSKDSRRGKRQGGVCTVPEDITTGLCGCRPSCEHGGYLRKPLAMSERAPN